jgi:hypothetical protein
MFRDIILDTIIRNYELLVKTLSTIRILKFLLTNSSILSECSYLTIIFVFGLNALEALYSIVLKKDSDFKKFNLHCNANY